MANASMGPLVEERDGATAENCTEIPEDVVEKIVAMMPFRNLSEDVVEKIVAMMPFRNLFKARFLSKSWNSKFPHAARDSASTVNCSSLTFAKHVQSVSSKWPSYYPISVSRGDGSLAFDRASNKWQLLSLSYLPEVTPFAVTSRGPLICIISKDYDRKFSFLVTNVITQSWIKLPFFGPSDPNGYWTQYVPDLVTMLPLAADGYRVLCVYGAPYGSQSRGQDGLERVHTLLYDSKLQRWTSKESQGPRGSLIKFSQGLHILSSAYLDEKLYMCCYSNYDIHRYRHGNQLLEMWMYDIRNNSWTEVPCVDGTNDGEDDRDAAHTTDKLSHGAVLRCGDKIMVTAWPVKEYTNAYAGEGPELPITRNSIKIYELIPGSLRLKFVDARPPKFIWGLAAFRKKFQFGSDADFIYFGQRSSSCRVMTFNVHTHKWSRLPQAPESSAKNALWGDFAFEPGLNPFIAV